MQLTISFSHCCGQVYLQVNLQLIQVRDGSTCWSELCPVSCDNCPCLNDFNDNGVCDENEIFGCAYIDAVNYDSLVTADNGSCVCELVSSNCPADLDSDGFVATTDLLMFLSSFGEVCEQQGSKSKNNFRLVILVCQLG